MILDDQEVSFTKPPPIGQGWIITFSDLISLILVFFVMMYSVSARDPSKVDATVSSVTDTFARSGVPSDAGSVAAQTGVAILDQEYLDDVITAFRGRDNFGDIKLMRGANGVITARLKRDDVFVSRTGVLLPQGVALAQDIARTLTRTHMQASLPHIEIRITGAKADLAAEIEGAAGGPPVSVRQASRFAHALVELQVPPQAIATLVLEGAAPALDIAFYAVSGGAQ